ncbi:DNA gyrase C-terminal beta-propeller domain-containing protein, partial [Actinotignum timonense]|nr:DNA gyrase C-terminal beta-propeller domain-containing protein [Actinotignum timonense]
HIGVVTSHGRMIDLDVLTVPALPDTAGAPSLAGGTPIVDLISLDSGERVIGLAPLTAAEGDPVLTLATAHGRIKRVNGAYPNKESWEVITLAEGDSVVGCALAGDTDQVVLMTSDAQLLRFEASLVRPQGRAGQGIAGIRCAEGAQVIALGVVPGDDLAGSLVATIASNAQALPGTEPGSAKVTPLDRFPAKGRGTGGVRAPRNPEKSDPLSGCPRPAREPPRY